MIFIRVFKLLIFLNSANHIKVIWFPDFLIVFKLIFDKSKWKGVRILFSMVYKGIVEDEKKDYQLKAIKELERNK